MKIKTPVIYRLLQERMKRHVDVAPDIISLSKCRWVITRYNIPRNLSSIIIKEMIHYKLLVKADLFNLKIVNLCCKPLEDDIITIAQEVGLW
jgi:hypothetical protein